MQKITITKPDDWHVHLRDDFILEGVVKDSLKNFSRILVMPNLVNPIKNTQDAINYKTRIINAIKKLKIHNYFEPLMSIYLTDNTSEKDIELAFRSGVIFGVKLYPFRSTTNSFDGVTDLFGKCSLVLYKMEELGIPLLIHGEVFNKTVDIFDRELIFIENIAIPLKEKFPKLKIVLEHISTKDAVEYVKSAKDPIAATITPQHLFYNRNIIFNHGLNPHFYCLPILKREKHRLALIEAATINNTKFFIGTDSAPHSKENKENESGCAGCYSACYAVEMYATIFDRVGCIDKLEQFISFNGPNFYGLPYNSTKINLIKQSHIIPKKLNRNIEIVPLGAGELLDWKLVE
ncbi:Dihydroorotase [Candidatus Kinetoplastibacterium sorsogonicusi]|uniref:Dihydroorotase n=1 Tax=Candidatus Kinetoplastidibacterium kentomonadis TaxID=1576550 RepID=A0A3S7JAG8_9PROT|nr:dihydroorotase [Candidatus Kinetoplastibacterium sorsogonicusi]AWD32664.1 Dihydroorotase [Candidatus Kinetoplastibacterium sorsogonicusi]